MSVLESFFKTFHNTRSPRDSCHQGLAVLATAPASAPGSSPVQSRLQGTHCRTAKSAQQFQKASRLVFHFIPVSNLDCQCEFLFFFVWSHLVLRAVCFMFLYMESCRGSSGAGCVHNSSFFHGGCVSNSWLYSAVLH